MLRRFLKRFGIRPVFKPARVVFISTHLILIGQFTPRSSVSDRLRLKRGIAAQDVAADNPVPVPGRRVSA